MPEDTTSTETVDESTETEEPQEDQEDGGDDGGGEQSQEDGDAKSKDDWRKNFDAKKASDRIRKLQSENQNLRKRTQKNDTDKDTRITALETELLRERVARKLQLPDKLVDRLRGDTEEELLEDAKQLVDLVSEKRPATRRPSETLRSGTDQETEPEETDVRKLGERMFRR